MTLWRIRATVDDRPGFLSVLTASLALRKVNILSVQVHTTEAGAVDDFLVDAPDKLTAADLIEAVRRGRGRDPWVGRADVRGLVDEPTRVLALAAQGARRNRDRWRRRSRALLGDCDISWRADASTGAEGYTATGMQLPDPAGGTLYVRRAAPAFTPAEYARAHALVGLAQVAGARATDPQLPETLPQQRRSLAEDGRCFVGSSHVVCRHVGWVHVGGQPMNALDSARWQFAVTASLHFLFVVAHARAGLLRRRHADPLRAYRRPVYGRMARFWGSLYAINYAVGIATGLVMEFEIGLNWSGLSRLTGDVFGAPLALETLIAFVLESTLLGMWLFGWGRLDKRLHLALIWGVAATALLSAFWVHGRQRVPAAPRRLRAGQRRHGPAHRLRRAAHQQRPVVRPRPHRLRAPCSPAACSSPASARGTCGAAAARAAEFFRRSLRTGVCRPRWSACSSPWASATPSSGRSTDNQPTKLAGDGEDALARRPDASRSSARATTCPTGIVGASLGFMIMVANLLFLVPARRAVLAVSATRSSSRRWARPMLWLLTALIPCRSSPRSPAGSSARRAASRGPSTGCSRPPTRCHR